MLTVILVGQLPCNNHQNLALELTMCSFTDGSNRHGTTGSGLTGGHTSGTTGSGLTGHNDSTGYGSHGTGSGLTGRNDNTGFGTGSTTAGPHSSNLGNKADPRVDSDLGQSILLI